MEPQSLDLGACHLGRESRPAVQVHTAETHRPSRSGMPSREGRTTTEEGSAGEVCGASANVRPEQGFGIKARMQRATPPTCPAAESATAQPRMPAPRRACVWHSRRPGQWRLCTALAASHCTMRFVGRTRRAIGIAPLRAELDRARRDRDALDRPVASISFHARPSARCLRRLRFVPPHRVPSPTRAGDIASHRQPCCSPASSSSPMPSALSVCRVNQVTDHKCCLIVCRRRYQTG